MTRLEIIEKLATFMLDDEHAIFISSHLLSDLHKIADYVTLLHEGPICMQIGMDELPQQYYEIRCTKDQLEALPVSLIQYQRPFKERYQALCLQQHKAILDRLKLTYQVVDLEMIMYVMCQRGEID